jgi:hypothetical protein
MTQHDGDQPRIQNRAEQPYAGIRVAVTMAGFPAAADSTFPALFAWLGSRGGWQGWVRCGRRRGLG